MIAACWSSAAPVSWELHLSWSPEAALGPAGSSFGVSDLRDDFFFKGRKGMSRFCEAGDKRSVSGDQVPIRAN